MRRIVVIMSCLLLVFAIGCGDDPPSGNNGGVNNGGTNNGGGSNNGGANNGGSNNGGTNNGGTNNGGTNNGGTNNGGTNNGGTNNGGTNNGGTDQLSEDFWGLLCEVAFQCPTAGNVDLVSLFTRYGSEADCKASQRRFGFGFEDTVRDVEAGRASYDAAQAQTCLSDWKNELCDADGEGLNSAIPASCENVFTGTVGEGGNCLTENACTGNLECVPIDNACYGTCDQPEEETIDCGSTTCTSDQYCDDNDTCQPRKAENVDCEFDQCQEGLACLQESFSEPGTCVPLGSVQQDGACSSNRFCDAGLVCDNDDTCQPVVFGSQGDACSIGGADRCGPGLACQDITIDMGTASGTCGPLKAEGEECLTLFQCEVGTWCDAELPSKGQCQPAKPNGDACESDFECMSEVCDASDQCVAHMACMLP